MKNTTVILLGISIGLFLGLMLNYVIPNKVDSVTLQETVRAAVVLNEARLEKRYFDLENRYTELENRVFNLECVKVKGCVKK